MRSRRGRRCTSSARSTTRPRWRGSASCSAIASRSATPAPRFVTPERFPEADELVVEWPDRFLAARPSTSATAICVLTHDEKFDVPALIAALETPGRLHRRDGQQGDDRRPRGAAPRRGCRRRRHRPDPCPDRARDRRPLARGGRGRDRRARSSRRPPLARRRATRERGAVSLLGPSRLLDGQRSLHAAGGVAGDRAQVRELARLQRHLQRGRLAGLEAAASSCPRS